MIASWMVFNSLTATIPIMTSFVLRLPFALVAIAIFSNVAMAQMVVAHRGASHDAPENTLSAFRLAWQQSADGVEGDFYLTADDHIVCIHDKDTLRTGGLKKTVEASTLSELRKLEYGRWKDKQYEGEPIPTLDQVIETVPDGKTLVIELKSTQRILPKLIEALKRNSSRPITFMVIAFDAPTAAAFKKEMPTIKTHWLTSFKRSTPLSSARPTAKEIAKIVRENGLDGVGMKGDVDVIDQKFVNALKSGGCGEFHVWTIDNIPTAKLFQSLGAMGITTNMPAPIGAALR